MNKNSAVLTPSEFLFILVSSTIGISILSLPQKLVTTCGQDAWIAVAIGSIYPIYLMILGTFMAKEYPNENILDLSKKFLGKYIGTALNLVFISQFLLLVVAVTSGLNNIIIIYVVPFLSPITITLVLYIASCYICYLGLNTLGKVNEITFYGSIPLLLIPISALRHGSFLNISPIFQSSIKNLLKGGYDSLPACCGIEIFFLLYPYVIDKSKIKSSAFKSIGIFTATYVWFTFITIYYLGIDVTSKFLWPFITVTETIKVPSINNFRFIFMFLWSILVIKTASNNYYGLTLILKNSFNKLNRKILCISLLPILIFLSLQLNSPLKRRTFLDIVGPPISLFNICYVTLISLLILIRGNDKNEKEKNTND